MREILSDLVAEQQSLDQFLQRLHEREWKTPTNVNNWTVHDTISHLAGTETLAAEVVKDGQAAIDAAAITDIDSWTAEQVAQGRTLRYQAVIEWWRNGRASVVDALSRRRSNDRIPWLETSMSPKAFATARLMETWAHGLDIKAAMEHKHPLIDEEGEPIPDSPRIRHVAWLAQRMLPWAFEQAGAEYPQAGVRIELMGPKYARWVYGPDEAEDVIKGLAGEFCRVAVHRLDPNDTALKAVGPGAELALQIVRTF
jgi:uncharacterized protein (TIGR03084 family)